jgi:hypothetical protein
LDKIEKKKTLKIHQYGRKQLNELFEKYKKCMVKKHMEDTNQMLY